MLGAGSDSRSRPLVVSICAGALFVSLCSVGLRRSYSYDESVTVGFFVRQPNFVEAITSQWVFNNHPLLTAINWVVYQLGGDTEAWQRSPAVAAGTACVVLVVWWSTRRWGVAAGIAAGLMLAVNPLLVDLSTQARGYAFAALAAAASTTLILETQRAPHSRRSSVSYAAWVTVGLLAHLYVAIVFVGHGVLIARQHPARFRSWFRATAVGGLLAVLVYVPMLSSMVSATRTRDGTFVADFPLQVGEALFGQRLWGTVVLLVVLGLAASNRTTRPFVATLTVLIVGVWVVVQPFDLYPRFLIWAVPLVGFLAAAVVARHPVSIVPVLVIAAIGFPATLDRVRDESDIRTVSSSARSFEERGFGVCVAGFYWESFVAYGVFPPVEDGRRCDLIIVRADDLDDPSVRGLVVAALPSSERTCVAGREHVIASLDLPATGCGAA